MPTNLGGSRCDTSVCYLITITLCYWVKIGSWSIFKTVTAFILSYNRILWKTHENKNVFKKSI